MVILFLRENLFSFAIFGIILQVYPVNNRGQSRALIINNVQFENRPDNVRHGAEKDSENLKILLIGLGFKVEIRQSLEKEVSAMLVYSA